MYSGTTKKSTARTMFTAGEDDSQISPAAGIGPEHPKDTFGQIIFCININLKNFENTNASLFSVTSTAQQITN